MAEIAAASVSDIRLVGLMLDVLAQAWAGALGGGPHPNSVLANDLHESSTFATERLPDPFSQSWAYSQTLGLVATNHEAILRESLLNYANSHTKTLPVTVVTTLARTVLETLATQAWLIDPNIDRHERFARWMALECQSERAAWKALHPGVAHIENPILRQLALDADMLGIARDSRMPPEWIGVNRTEFTTIAGALLQKYPAATGAAGIATTGDVFYRLFSGEIHGTVGNVLGLLLASGDVSDEGGPIHVYGLSHGALWRAAAIVLMSTYAARCVYASWLGLPVDSETTRLHMSHVDTAVWKLL